MRLRIILAPLVVLLLGGCSTLGYYTQLLKGQVALLNARQPITAIIDDPARDPLLRQRLQTVLAARRFAVTALHLPDNGSYRQYVELGRPFVVWNVFATPEFSLEPKQWCYPLVGCLAYRGYYEQARAAQAAAALRDEGLDVYVGGVPAYSTLGWFDDPVSSAMLRWDDLTLIETLFHELAHQQYFVNGDTAFNESFASFVGEQGLRLWLAARGDDAAAADALRARQDAFVKLVQQTRTALAALYAQTLPPAEMRARKQARFDALRADYHRLRDQDWNGYRGYDAWFDGPLNNAQLVPVGLYNTWVPAFAQLYAECGGDWPRYYAAVAALGELPAAQRQQRLEALGRDAH